MNTLFISVWRYKTNMGPNTLDAVQFTFLSEVHVVRGKKKTKSYWNRVLISPNSIACRRQTCFITSLWITALTKLALRFLRCARHLYLGDLEEVFDFSFIQSAHVVNVGLEKEREQHLEAQIQSSCVLKCGVVWCLRKKTHSCCWIRWDNCTENQISSQSYVLIPL